MEEDDATIDDGHFLYSATVNNWYNIPSWAHRNGTTLVFADGHGEYWRWQSARPTTTYFTFRQRAYRSVGPGGRRADAKDGAGLKLIVKAYHFPFAFPASWRFNIRS